MLHEAGANYGKREKIRTSKKKAPAGIETGVGEERPGLGGG
jgi:hypothetical protein